MGDLIEFVEAGTAAAALNERFAQSDAAWIGVVVDVPESAARSSTDEIKRKLDRLDDVDVAILSPLTAFLFRHAWSTYSGVAAALLGPPPPGATVFVRGTGIERIGDFRDVEDPMWDFVIRASAHNPSGVQLLDVNAVTSPLDAQSIASSTPAEDRLPPLSPLQPPRRLGWLRDHLLNVEPNQLVPDATSEPDVTALRAGLLQIHDFLDESHEQSQSVEGEGRRNAGDYWHGINHRREPDYSNARYWFRRVGDHAVFPQLAACAVRVLGDSPLADEWRPKLTPVGRWDPFAFVDLCQSAEHTDDEYTLSAAKRFQWCEMMLLIDATWRDAR